MPKHIKKKAEKKNKKWFLITSEYIHKQGTLW